MTIVIFIFSYRFGLAVLFLCRDLRVPVQLCVYCGLAIPATLPGRVARPPLPPRHHHPCLCRWAGVLGLANTPTKE